MGDDHNCQNKRYDSIMISPCEVNNMKCKDNSSSNGDLNKYNNESFDTDSSMIIANNYKTKSALRKEKRKNRRKQQRKQLEHIALAITLQRTIDEQRALYGEADPEYEQLLRKYFPDAGDTLRIDSNTGDLLNLPGSLYIPTPSTKPAIANQQTQTLPKHCLKQDSYDSGFGSLDYSNAKLGTFPKPDVMTSVQLYNLLEFDHECPDNRNQKTSWNTSNRCNPGEVPKQSGVRCAICRFIHRLIRRAEKVLAHYFVPETINRTIYNAGCFISQLPISGVIFGSLLLTRGGKATEFDIPIELPSLLHIGIFGAYILIIKSVEASYS